MSGGQFAIDGCGAEVFSDEWSFQAVKAFCSPYDQQSAGYQKFVELLAHPLPNWCVEIDQHITAEDHIELACDIQTIDQVQSAKFNHSAKLFRSHPEVSFRAEIPGAMFDCQSTINQVIGKATFPGCGE